MSPSISALVVRTDDPTAQVKVFDASSNTVAEGLGGLDAKLLDGLYKIRVRVGPEFQERLVALDDKLPAQHFKRMQFATPIPIDQTGRSHEYHQEAIKHAWENPGPAQGHGSRLLISAREWSSDGSRGHPDPAGALFIVLSSEERVPFSSFALTRLEGDACAIGVIDVDPGYYRVELLLADGTRQRRALHASRGWASQLYMLFHDVGEQRLPNLASGSVAIANHPVVHDPETRLVEIALDALTQHRPILSDELLGLLSGKFQQPLLGILGAHLLIRDFDKSGLFGEVIHNLTRMLGVDHPDVAALRTKSGEPPLPLTEPPMLRASWDLLVEASARYPDLIPAGSPASWMAELVIPTGAWLVWQPRENKDDDRSFQAKLEVVRAYVSAQTQPRPSLDINEAVFARGSFGGTASMLGANSRADLSRALGVPSATLDNLLGKL